MTSAVLPVSIDLAVSLEAEQRRWCITSAASN